MDGRAMRGGGSHEGRAALCGISLRNGVLAWLHALLSVLLAPRSLLPVPCSMLLVPPSPTPPGRRHSSGQRLYSPPFPLGGGGTGESVPLSHDGYGAIPNGSPEPCLSREHPRGKLFSSPNLLDRARLPAPRGQGPWTALRVLGRTLRTLPRLADRPQGDQRMA